MIGNSQLLLPIALGCSIVTVTAVVVYYVFKKDDETFASDKTVKSSRVNTIEIKVPKKILPALIGRNGSNIKGVEQKTGAMIHFKKFTDKEYDTCVVRGRSEATQLAETMIHEFIKQQPEIVQEAMDVPSWACGRIIGKGGDSINDISHRSGARVKVEGQAVDATMRQINLRGTKEQIAVARQLIENCVAQEKCRREIEQSQRASRHIQTVPPPTPPSVAAAAPPAAPEAPLSASAATTLLVKETEDSEMSETEGSTIEVYVSAVATPSRFWVQFVGSQVTALDDLVTLMTDFYRSRENREAHAVTGVALGQVVAAVFRHDGRWYRARVTDISPNEFGAQEVADVFYVDYGDSDYVPIQHLCSLRADMLRLRFQAMECFLAGVAPPPSAQWSPEAVERFEELTHVAQWKPLKSKTCTYKRSPGTPLPGERAKDVPGIKLYDVTEEGEVDIGAVLVTEGLAVEAPLAPRHSPARPTHPFGDLGNSRVLGMSGESARASSLPKDHKDDGAGGQATAPDTPNNGNELTTSKSLGSGLEQSKHVDSVSNLEIYPTASMHPNFSQSATKLNGTNVLEDFMNAERHNTYREVSADTPAPAFSNASRTRDENKANMNRLDSHHSSLDALGKQS